MKKMILLLIVCGICISGCTRDSESKLQTIDSEESIEVIIDSGEELMISLHENDELKTKIEELTILTGTWVPLDSKGNADFTEFFIVHHQNREVIIHKFFLKDDRINNYSFTAKQKYNEINYSSSEYNFNFSIHDPGIKRDVPDFITSDVIGICFEQISSEHTESVESKTQYMKRIESNEVSFLLSQP